MPPSYAQELVYPAELADMAYDVYTVHKGLVVRASG